MVTSSPPGETAAALARYGSDARCHLDKQRLVILGSLLATAVAVARLVVWGITADLTPKPPAAPEAVVDPQAARWEAQEALKAQWRNEPLPQVQPPEQTIVFIVMDTVRADHMSLCGYDRPTTPTLERLATRPDAALSCTAYAPGSWSLPSHVSFFTGLPVVKHGADFAPPELGQGVPRTLSNGTVRKMPADVPTLAEGLQSRGYQTVSVAANPWVSPITGLTRGFDQVRPALDPPQWVADIEVVFEIERLVREELDASKPLFLFVNLGDAHGPWFSVPEGHPWLPPGDGDWVSDFATIQRFMKGEMDPAERTRFTQELTNVYDHGLWSADQAIAHIVALLNGSGWLSHGMRLVVTADHGEHLGEMGVIDHGFHLSDPNNRVPLLMIDTAIAPPPLPDPVSALVAHDLVLGGGLPNPLPRVASALFPQSDSFWKLGLFKPTLQAAWWGGGPLLKYDGGEFTADGEPTEAPNPAFVEYVEAVRDWEGVAAPVDPELQQALEALGYLGDTPPE